LGWRCIKQFIEYDYIIFSVLVLYTKMASFRDILEPSSKNIDISVDNINCNTINDQPYPPAVPIIGTISTNHIPIGSNVNPPIFQDSNMEITQLSLIPVEAKILDLNTAYPLTSTIVNIRDTINNENQMYVGVTGLGEDSDLIIGNQSTGSSKIIAIFNGSPNGSVAITGDEVIINDNGINSVSVSQSNGIGLYHDNNSITLNNNQISMSNDGGINGLNMNAFGTYISSNVQNVLQSVTNSLTVSPSEIQINSSNNLFINSQNVLTLQDSLGDNISITPNQININSQGTFLLNENANFHFLSMNGSGVILASNSGQPLTLATDNELRLKASSSYGLSNQVLTSNGLGYCDWQYPQIMNQTIYRLTNILPNGSGTGTQRVFNESGQALNISGTGNSTNSICYLRVDPNDYPALIGNKVPRLQLVHNVITNGTAPASSFSVELRSYTSSGASNAMTITAGAVFGNSTTVTTPVLNSTTTASSIPFALPVSASNYIVVLTNTALTASFTHHSIYLKVVYI
jgi:hypothetical protein